MKKRLNLLAAIILFSNLSQAQFIKEKSLNAQIGFGVSSPFESADDVAGTGFFLQGEFVMHITSWVELKPYAGLILTNSNGKDLNDNPTDEKVESKAFWFGGKARLRAPIPWVAPYIELGFGASIGKFETLTTFTNIEKKGLSFHIPFAFGLELGRNNNIDLGFSFYIHPTVEQSVGAFAVEISIPLKNKS
ncbi:outer membrane beta-barrel protein [Winogradskyella schleiferi]|uniref:outer membrane beta-barrel protein n=1 Tax=Winogradskyella schleiferi TaxID=2686078 RepID=UPI0015BD85C2|nr:outer membrane beta-barrel protein [Winogradskyella schleiferi]